MTAKGGNGIDRIHADRQTALTCHRIPSIDREIDQGCFELRDIRRRKTLGIAKIEFDMNSSGHEWADELRDAFDL
jgi:hypothetical protein